MPNPVKGEVPLKLSDGREFVLVLDFEALVEAEAMYGKPLARLMAEAASGFVGATRALLYGALRAKHPTMTPRDASNLFLEHSDEVSAALEAAGNTALPDVEGKDDKNPPAKPRRGKTSGGSGAKRA